MIVKLLQIWDGYNPFFVFATRVEMLCWYDIHFSEKEIIRVKTQRSVRAVCELNTFGAGFFIVQEHPQLSLIQSAEDQSWMLFLNNLLGSYHPSMI